MYSARWSRDRLRQGDILTKLPFPDWKKPVVWQVEGTIIGALQEAALIPSSIPTELRHVMVVSHDCEFSEGKRSHFLVARIDPISKRTTAEQLETLRASNDIRKASEKEQPAYLDSFYLEPVKDVLNDFNRVNFTALAAFPIDTRVEALKRKVAELDHATRVQLREKLGVFFGRKMDDIPDAEKYDPPPPEGSITQP